MSRNGKHKEGSVRIGIYLTQDRKAVASHLAQLEGVTITEIVWEGIVALAKQKKVMMPSGEIAEDHQAAISTIKSIIKQTNGVKG